MPAAFFVLGRIFVPGANFVLAGFFFVPAALFLLEEFLCQQHFLLAGIFAPAAIIC